MFTNKFRLFLGIIAVIAVLVVILYLKNKNSAAENNREEISTALNNIAANAQTHFKRANSFDGWVLLLHQYISAVALVKRFI